ncbi:hypothetical protein TCAL_08782 [Tigriopus californicus]|uniref:Major facilitator superfamily (MFS) profile domain-containing protein n=1 Tax=Tigriopus californicus TaxID=6832 RepID=A0A553PG30_TIGCA|nr:hypothetical protein TCAL_08782 [Tigriopus californicus]
MIGFGLGFSAIFLPHIETQGIKESSSLNQASSPDIGSNEISWIASMLSVGQIFGSLSVSIGGNVLGRKGVMLLSCLPIFLGWLTLFAAQSLALVLVGRLLTGLGMGMQGAIHAVYVSELVNPKWIGTATASGVTTITWGILVAFILGSLIHWREASPSVNSYIATITIGLVQVFGSLLGVVLIRKLGNRFLLLCSSLGSFISMAALGLTLYVGKQHPEFEFLEWLPVLWLVAFTISFTSGLAPVPWVLMGKLFAGIIFDCNPNLQISHYFFCFSVVF